jgi:hypothetical protein
MTRGKRREEVLSLTVTSGEVRVPRATTCSSEFVGDFSPLLASARIVNSLVKVSAEETPREVLRTINRALRGESEPAKKETESARMGSLSE